MKSRKRAREESEDERAREESEDDPKKESAVEDMREKQKAPGVEVLTNQKNKTGLYDDLQEETVEIIDPTKRGNNHYHSWLFTI